MKKEKNKITSATEVKQGNAGVPIKKLDKAEKIGLLQDMLNILKVVFENYRYELLEKYDILLDEYDLTDIEVFIQQLEGE